MIDLTTALSGLKPYKQFVVYKIQPSKTRPGKTDKLPVNYDTGKPLANWNNTVAWLDADTAIAAAHKLGKNHGVGFVFTEQDPFFFLDIDNCFDDKKQWSNLAQQLCSEFYGAAIEVSSSYTGLHIIGSYSQLHNEHACKNKEHAIELYTSNHFVALTGISAIGSVVYDCTRQLHFLIDRYFTKQTTVKFDWTNEPVPDWNGPTDDQELINRALSSRSAKSIFGEGATFKDLWENNTEVLARAYNNDVSSYDAALALHLAYWTGNNCERILHLMKQSRLVREKWNREKYLTLTISKACGKQRKWFNEKIIHINDAPLPEQVPTINSTNKLLTADQQQELFKGCVYICDIHRVLVPGGNSLRAEQFRVMYGGYSFVVDQMNSRVVRNAWEAFTESQVSRNPRVDSSCFRPDLKPAEIITENGRSYVNVYWPVEIIRKKGDVSLFLTHLEKVLPNKQDQLILLSYMAACVQYKGKKFQWAPVLQGVQGNGKTFFTSCVAYAVGMRYVHFPQAKDLANKFNSWMYEKIFIGVEDVFVPESQREVMEALKPMITARYLEIEKKTVDKITLTVCCNFIINTNHKDGLRKSIDDRRFAPFYTAQQSPDDLIRDGMTGNYFSNLYDWLHEDGFKIVAELLYTFEIPDELNPATNCQRAPLTSSTQDAIIHGMGALEQEIIEAIEQDIMGFRGGWVSSIQLDRLLERLFANRRISHQKRRDLLRSLGYDWHPNLKEGRVNNVILPDGGKPRLYIKKDHPDLNLTNSADIAQAYTTAQTL